MNEDCAETNISSNRTETKENNNHQKIHNNELDTFDIDNDDSQEFEPFRPLKKHLESDVSNIQYGKTNNLNNGLSNRGDEGHSETAIENTRQKENDSTTDILIETKINNDLNVQKKDLDTFDIDNDDSQELEPYRPLKKRLKIDSYLLDNPDENKQTSVKITETEPVSSHLTPAIEQGLSSESLKSCDSYLLDNQDDDNNQTSIKTTEREPVFGRLTPSIEQDLSRDSFNAFKKFNSIINSTDRFDLVSDEDKEAVDGYRPLRRTTTTTCPSFSSLGRTVDVNERSDGLESNMAKRECSDNSMDSLETKERTPEKQKVVYVYSDELKEQTNKLTRIENRAELTHSLIQTYGLLKYITVVSPRAATEAEILGFHCPQYIQCLQKCGSFVDADDLPDTLSEEAEGYGLSYDCPQQAGIFEAASLISGASICGAQCLVDGVGDIAINWCGGWHHAKRDSASGFCYINDIVLSILKLKERHDRVLYVDLDLHHGDGVEEAFEMTPTVMTVSFHKYDAGFFPGSGCISDVGSGRGKFYSVNVPLKDGIKDAEFFSVFTRVMKQVKAAFAPQALVLQCGADTLGHDPMATFNLTHVGVARCVCWCLAWRLPTLLLGGGGYDFPSTAKTWTFLTAVAAGKKLPLDIPEHEHLLQYGPGYDLTTTVSNRRDLNTAQSLAHVIHTVTQNLGNIKKQETSKT